MAVSMSNMNKHGGSPLGAGHGGYGGFAPSPGYPGGPPKVPPGTAAPVPGRPHYPKPKKPFSKERRLFGEPGPAKSDSPRPHRELLNPRKAKTAMKWWLDQLGPLGGVDGAFSTPSGWSVPAGWTRCPTPDWNAFSFCGPEPLPTHYAAVPGTFDNSTCAPIGFCPGSQVIPSALPLPVTATPPFRVHYYAQTGATFDWLRTYNAPGGSESNAYRRGVVILPDVLAETDPLAAVSPQASGVEKTYGGTRPAVGTRTRDEARPGVDGDTPANRPPDVASRPPARGDKEEKWVLPTNSPLQRAWGALTEGMDAADCMEKAVRATGAKRKKGENGRTGQMKFLARSLAQGHGDPRVFFACMATENAEDALIGKSHQAVNKSLGKNPYYKRPAGFGFGGWGQRMR